MGPPQGKRAPRVGPICIVTRARERTITDWKQCHGGHGFRTVRASVFRGRLSRCLTKVAALAKREFFIDNLLVQIHFIIVMIRWTGLAPWEFEFPFPGSLTSTFLVTLTKVVALQGLFSSSLLLSSLELSDTQVYEP